MRGPIAVTALWLLAAAGLPFAHPPVDGLLFVLLGVLSPHAFSWSRSRPVSWRRWRNAATAAWTTGALGAVVYFTRALGDTKRDIEQIGSGMALSLAPALAGLVVAGLCGALAFRFAAEPEAAPSEGAEDGWRGRLAFPALVVWAIAVPLRGGDGPWFASAALLLHGPALLTWAGAGVLFILLCGGPWRRLAPVAAALGGTLAALAGLAQALLGMVHVSIPEVTAGLRSVTSASAAALVALALFATPGPAGDREGGAEIANRIAQALFPLIAVLLLGVTLVMVMTPMTKPL